MASRRGRVFVPFAVLGLLTALGVQSQAAPATPVTFTILHTNDFHGQLEPSGSNPGAARVAYVVNDIRSAVGADNVLLVDAGDELQGSLLSNMGRGLPTIGTFDAMGYAVATFGNHEFDWGQTTLAERTGQATYPFVTANIVKNDTGNCGTAGWEKPDFADAPYTVLSVGAPAAVKVAFIGVTTAETPTITMASATAGLCFKDPAESILHYYDAMKADGADVIVVLSHLGYADGGYGYGIPIYGDQTLAARLNTAGKPANLIVGGHSHSNLSAATMVGSTAVAQAYYNSRTVGRANVTVTPTGGVSVAWSRTTGFSGGAKDPAIDALVTSYASDPTYQAMINTPVGYSAVDLLRSATADNMMGAFIDDAIYGYLNSDTDSANDVDVFFNSAGGLRADWCWNGTAWVNTGCAAGVHAAALLTYGQMFTILPFGNATVVGDMTGAQLLEMLNQAPLVGNGVIQPAGLKYKYFAYKDKVNPPGTATSPYTYAWGAFDPCVVDRGTGVCGPLDLNKTYRVGTNEFLAPAGGDGYSAFKYMRNITYWGDMLNAVDAYVAAHHGTPETAYLGPNGDGTLDGRIVRDGDDSGGSILPVTILHHNDSHGNLAKGAYVGYTQLATLIQQERAHNPARTLLVSGGDNIQGDALSFFFRTAPLGYGADGVTLPADLQAQPLVKAFNAVGYDAMVLGNHEFNFGSQVFQAVLGGAEFPILGANVADDGRYGLAAVQGGAGVKPYVETDLGGIKVALLGITNHRVPNYELPTNILGLSFSDPFVTAQTLSDDLRTANDAVVALTHIGFTEDPKSVEVDHYVDTNLAKTVTGIDAIVGAHSHTNPATGFGDYKYLPAVVADPDGTPVLINQAYRYNNTLGEVVLGMRARMGGGYEVVTRTGRYLSVPSSTAEDAAVKALIDPYVAWFSAYNSSFVGRTMVPIDTLQGFTEETNGANLQADASLFELAKEGVAGVDFHLSGAMTNKAIATTGPYPDDLFVSDLFTLMPYENSLVVLDMNGPQLKAVLERAYRNFYYYKYVPGYGAYSYYTTCMLDINAGGQITYNDLYPEGYDSNKQYVVSLTFDGQEVDFTDASTYYRVSTVNYLASGSCNFNDSGLTLWPLGQIVADTQYYVRDAVIDYVKAAGIVSPAVEDRLKFISDTSAPLINITAPEAGAEYLHPDLLTLVFDAVDVGEAGVRSVQADLDGTPVTSGQVIDLLTLALGDHTLTVNAEDKAYNTSTESVTFSVTATPESLTDAVERFYDEGKIKNGGIRNSLLQKLAQVEAALAKGKSKVAANVLNALINEVKAQAGNQITAEAAAILIADIRWVIAHLP